MTMPRRLVRETNPAVEVATVPAIVARLAEVDAIKMAVAALEIGNSNPTKMPAAVVLPLAEDSPENIAPRAGVVQRVTARIGVIHVLPSPNDLRGSKSVDPLSELLGATRRSLNGWAPNNRQDALAFRRGVFLGFEDGAAAWQDEYLTSWTVAQAHQE